jgi:hypothetical protein
MADRGRHERQEVERRVARELGRIADALEARVRRRDKLPAWAERMEAKMADLDQAILDLQAATKSVVEDAKNAVVNELHRLSDEVRNAPDTDAAAEKISAVAESLSQAAVDMKSAVDETDGDEAAPADPGTGEAPADGTAEPLPDLPGDPVNTEDLGTGDGGDLPPA